MRSAPVERIWNFANLCTIPASRILRQRNVVHLIDMSLIPEWASQNTIHQTRHPCFDGIYCGVRDTQDPHFPHAT